LSSVLHRAQPSISERDTVIIVVLDVAMQTLLKLINAAKFVQVKELGLQSGEEALYGGIVQTIAFPGHALENSMF
jgi:hypothetical protein